MNRSRNGSRVGEARRISPGGGGAGGGKNGVDFVDYTRLCSPPKRGPLSLPSLATTVGRGASSSSSACRQTNPYKNPTRKISLAVELKQRLLSIQELNNALSTEVSNLQRDKGDLIQRVNSLEVAIKENHDKVLLLDEEKRELSSGMVEHRDLMHSKEKEMSSLTAEKRVLEAEKLSVMDRKCELEGLLADAERKIRDSLMRADDAEATVTMALQELDNLNSKVSKSHGSCEQTFIAELTKKIELNGLQSCKTVLRKELKRFSNLVLKANDQVLDAKATIEALEQEQDRWKEDKGRLLAAQEAATERSNQLEKQELNLQENIHGLEARVRELEGELRSYKEDKKRILAEAATLTSEEPAAACSCAHQRIEMIKSNIQMLRDNSLRVTAMQKQVAEMGKGNEPEEQAAVEAVKGELREKMKLLANESTEAMNTAEQQLASLRKEVEGLDAAFMVARDASHQSEHDVWETVGKLGVGKDSSLIPAIPAGATYVLALGLFAYTLYSSTSSSH